MTNMVLQSLMSYIIDDYITAKLKDFIHGQPTTSIKCPIIGVEVNNGHYIIENTKKTQEQYSDLYLINQNK